MVFVAGTSYGAEYRIKLAARMNAVGSRFGSFAIEEGYYPAFQPVVMNDAGDLALALLTGPNGKAAVWVREHNWLAGSIVFEAFNSNQQISEITSDGDDGVLFTLTEEARALGIYRYSFAAGKVTLLTAEPKGLSAYRALRSLNNGTYAAKLSFGALAQELSYFSDGIWHKLASTRSIDAASKFYFFHGVHFVNKLDVVVHALHSISAGDSAIYYLRPGRDPELLVAAGDNEGDAGSGFLAPWLVGNERGDLLYSRYAKRGGLKWILRRTNGQILTIPPRDVEGQAELFPAVLNDAGMVALRINVNGRSGIYLSTDAILTPIVRGGDQVVTDLGVATIGKVDAQTGIFNNAPTMNRRGDVAFVCDLKTSKSFAQSIEDQAIEEGIGIGLFIARRLD